MIRFLELFIATLFSSDFFLLKGSKSIWVYGRCNGVSARRHKKNGNVQFVLWTAGEQGHTEDYWHNFDNYWWRDFKPDGDA